MLALALAAGPALADGEWDVFWKNGTRVESEDGEFSLKFGGRIQADWTFVASQDDGLEARIGKLTDGSELRRARLFFEGTIYGNVAFRAQYDFAGGAAEANDVFIAFQGTPVGEIKLGHFKEPFSLEEITSGKYLAFLDRSLPIIFAPGRNFGVQVSDSPSDKLNWGFGVFRESDGFATSVGDDVTNITGRVVFRPIYEDDGKRLLHLGLSATTKDTAGLGGDFRIRQRAEVHLGPRIIDTGGFTTDGEDILAIEVAGVYGPFWFAAEYVHPEVDTPDRGTLEFPGYYVQVGYFLTGENRKYKTADGSWDLQKPDQNWGEGGKGAWEIAARLSTTDLSDVDIVGDEADGVTIALNWYPNPATRMMLNYVMSEVRGIGGADFVLLRAQVDF